MEWKPAFNISLLKTETKNPSMVSTHASFDFLSEPLGLGRWWWVTDQQDSSHQSLRTLPDNSFITRYTFVFTWRRGTTFLWHWVRFSCLLTYVYIYICFSGSSWTISVKSQEQWSVIIVEFISASWLAVTLASNHECWRNCCNYITFTLTAWRMTAEGEEKVTEWDW